MGGLSSRATAGASGVGAGRVDSRMDAGFGGSRGGAPFGEGCGFASLTFADVSGLTFVSDAGVVPSGHTRGAGDVLVPGAVPVPGEVLGAEAIVVGLEAAGWWTS